MKHLTRKILALVLVLVSISAMLTGAFAASTDSLKLNATPEAGDITVDRKSGTTFSVTPVLTDSKGNNVTDMYEITYTWLLDGSTVSEKSYYHMPKNVVLTEESTLLCAVTAVHVTDHTRKTGYVAWYPTDDLIKDIHLIINGKLSTFNFTSTETQSGTSVYGEICEALGITKQDDQSKYTVSFVPNSGSVAFFEGLPVCALNNMDKAGLTILSTGKWVSEYTVVFDGKEILTGMLTIEVEPDVGTDAFYSAKLGESIVIPSDEFYKFWDENSEPGSTMNSVFITNCVGLGGTLCYNHTASEKSHANAVGMFLYTEPTAVQKGVKDLTFVPSKFAGKFTEGTVTITFIANGIDKDKKMVTLNGSFMLFYSNNEIQTITYECNGTYVMLSGDDFDAVYRAVTKSTAKNPVYSVRFLDVPKYGTLYRGYSDLGYATAGSTPLNETNIDTLSFSSISTTETSLDQLAYVPQTHNAAGDTVRYMVYSGTTVLYVGELHFNTKEVVVTYTVSAGKTVNFASTDFFTAGSPLLQAQFLVFGNPSSGTLYKNYATGERVYSGDYFSYNAAYGVNLLDNITYVPKDGFTGVVEITFCGTSLTGGAVNGKVRIYVVGDVFEDVASDHWSAPYINRLYAAGVISGTSATTFSPKMDVTYGQALKMILLAAGCPKQSENTGAHWAQYYLNYAYNNGFVNSNKIDLDLPVNRDTIAELTAKVLGLGMATGINPGIVPPVDSTNGYVYALYNAGIINGNMENGNNYFKGQNHLSREEMAKIICKVMDYKN